MKIRAIDDQLDYDEGGQQRTMVTGDRSCAWTATSPRRALYFIALDGEDYFANVYRARLLPIFRPLEVDGLPAVQQQSAPDAVVCTTTIDLGRGNALDLQVSLFEGDDGRAPDPCAEGRRVAEVIVAALPPA